MTGRESGWKVCATIACKLMRRMCEINQGMNVAANERITTRMIRKDRCINSSIATVIGEEKSDENGEAVMSCHTHILVEEEVMNCGRKRRERDRKQKEGQEN